MTVLRDLDNRQLLNTRVALGTELPASGDPPPDPELVARGEELARETHDAATAVLADRFQADDLRVSTKSSPADVVTDADLASEQAAFITGQCYLVNGGLYYL